MLGCQEEMFVDGEKLQKKSYSAGSLYNKTSARNARTSKHMLQNPDGDHCAMMMMMISLSRHS